MSITVRLAAYALVLALVAGVGWVSGRIVGPLGAESSAGHPARYEASPYDGSGDSTVPASRNLVRQSPTRPVRHMTEPSMLRQPCPASSMSQRRCRQPG